MTAILPALVAAAASVGAPIIKNVLQKHVGGVVGTLAGTVVDEVAARAGVKPEELPELRPEELGAAVQRVEAEMPELIALYQKGLEGQFALLSEDRREGVLASAWRWGWMYLLGFFWICAFLLFPLAKLFGLAIEPIDTATLMTLTGWFISLYMGGHTVKVLGQQALDAARNWRR